MREIRSHTGNRRRNSIRALLIVLAMVCSHAALASHQALHETSVDLSACLTCLAINAFDELLGNNDDRLSLTIVHITAETGDRPASANRTLSHTTIRAPPPTIS